MPIRKYAIFPSELNPSDIFAPDIEELSIIAYGNEIQISGHTIGEIISVYNLLGVKVYSQQLTNEGIKTIHGLREGIYVVTAEKARVTQK